MFICVDVSKMFYTINALPFQCVPGVKLIDLFSIYIYSLMGQSLTIAAVKATSKVYYTKFSWD